MEIYVGEGKMMEYRITFPTWDDKGNAMVLLDRNGIKYSFDSGGRMMIGINGLALLELNDIDYDEV